MKRGIPGMSASARIKTRAILLAILVLCMLFGCGVDGFNETTIPAKEAA